MRRIAKKAVCFSLSRELCLAQTNKRVNKSQALNLFTFYTLTSASQCGDVRYLNFKLEHCDNKRGANCPRYFNQSSERNLREDQLSKVMLRMLNAAQSEHKLLDFLFFKIHFITQANEFHYKFYSSLRSFLLTTLTMHSSRSICKLVQSSSVSTISSSLPNTLKTYITRLMPSLRES